MRCVSCGHSNSLELQAREPGPSSPYRRSERTLVCRNPRPTSANLLRRFLCFFCELMLQEEKADSGSLPGTRAKGRRVAGPALERDTIVPGGAPSLPSPPGQPQTTGHVLFLRNTAISQSPGFVGGQEGGGFTAAGAGGGGRGGGRGGGGEGGSLSWKPGSQTWPHDRTIKFGSQEATWAGKVAQRLCPSQPRT